MAPLAITGATGGLGGRVAARLVERGLAPRLVVRDPSRAPDLPGATIATSDGYHDREAMTAAFAGADTVFLVSGRESATRVEEHVSAIDAAVDAGVRRLLPTWSASEPRGVADDARTASGRNDSSEPVSAALISWNDELGTAPSVP